MAYRLVSLDNNQVRTKTFPSVSEVEDYLRTDGVGHLRLDGFCQETGDMHLNTVAEGKDTVLERFLLVNCDVAKYQADRQEWYAKHR